MMQTPPLQEAFAVLMNGRPPEFWAQRLTRFLTRGAEQSAAKGDWASVMLCLEALDRQKRKLGYDPELN